MSTKEDINKCVIKTSECVFDCINDDLTSTILGIQTYLVAFLYTLLTWI